MTILYNVHGSPEQAVPLIVQKDTVYVHENIRQETIDMIGESITTWVYDEKQYDKDEYIKLLSEENTNVKDAVEVLIMNSLGV